MGTFLYLQRMGATLQLAGHRPLISVASPAAERRALGPQQSWHVDFIALRHVGSPQSKGLASVPCVRRQIPDHWTAREVPRLILDCKADIQNSTGMNMQPAYAVASHYTLTHFLNQHLLITDNSYKWEKTFQHCWTWMTWPGSNTLVNISNGSRDIKHDFRKWQASSHCSKSG